MFARMTLFPVVILVYVLAAAGGSSPSGDGPRTRHITLDRRFPVPPPPVHPNVVGAAAGDAAARHRQLAGAPDSLVTGIQSAMAESGVHREGSPGLQALLPVQIRSATRLDHA